jgi:hypothetical protein
MTDVAIHGNFQVHIGNDRGAWIWHIVSDEPGANGVIASSAGACRSELEARLDCKQRLMAIPRSYVAY